MTSRRLSRIRRFLIASGVLIYVALLVASWPSGDPLNYVAVLTLTFIGGAITGPTTCRWITKRFNLDIIWDRIVDSVNFGG